MTKELASLTENYFKTYFEQLEKHWKKCVAANENYFVEGDKNIILYIFISNFFDTF